MYVDVKYLLACQIAEMEPGVRVLDAPLNPKPPNPKPPNPKP